MDEARYALLNRVVRVLLCGVLLVILVAGLRPQSSYSDEWVTFNSNQNHTVFRHYGLATGNLEQRVSKAIWQDSIDISMTVQLSLPPDNRFQVLAQIDSPSSLDPVIIGQWKSNLIIMSGRDYRHEHNLPRFSADLSAYMDSFVDIIVMFTPDTTTLEVNGQLMAHGPAIPVSQPPTRISIGNAPDGSHGWTGNLEHFQLQSNNADRTRIQYQFDNNNLPTIADSDDATFSLAVPEPGHFPDRAWIGALRLDQLIHNNLRDVIINFLGFMPFGFLMCSALPFRSARYSGMQNTALTIVSGFLLSLAIESAQSYIPGRSPHAHDLLLNTLGTATGAFSLLIIRKLWQLTASGPPEHAPARNPEHPGNH